MHEPKTTTGDRARITHANEVAFPQAFSAAWLSFTMQQNWSMCELSHQFIALVSFFPGCSGKLTPQRCAVNTQDQAKTPAEVKVQPLPSDWCHWFAAHGTNENDPEALQQSGTL